MNKRLDAYLREQTRALYQIKNYPMLGVASPRGRRVRSGRGLPQGRSLRDEYNTILNSMKRDGTLAALYEKVARHEARPRFFHCARVHDPLAAEITLLGRRSSAALPGGGRNAGREHTLRQKRQRLWYQRDGFLWGLVVALIAAAWGPFSHRREPRSASAAG